MNTPKKPINQVEETNPEWHEPFPEPQTIPEGWNTSNFVAASASDNQVDVPATCDD